MIKALTNSSISFKSHVPVRIYVKDEATKSYYPASDEKNIKNISNQLVRNLNGTLKNLSIPEFVELYKNEDKDYVKTPKAQAFCDYCSPDTILITGSDVEKIEKRAAKIKEKTSQSWNKYGHAKSYEVKDAKRDYIDYIKAFLTDDSRALKSDNDEKLHIETYFEPQYYSKGSKKGMLKGFKYVNARFLKESDMKSRPYILTIQEVEQEKKPDDFWNTANFRQMELSDYIKN